MKQLPMGVRIDKGYVQVRIMHKGRYYCKNFGADCDLARELASIHLSEKRKEILMGKFGVEPEIPRKRFSEVAEIYYKRWSEELDPDGKPRHGADGKKFVRAALDNHFIPHFGRMWYDEIKPKDIQALRDKRIQTVLGTSADRELVAMGSIWSNINEWVKAEKIKAFKLPENYMVGVESSQTRKRERVLTTTELKNLKAACLGANDGDLWEICTMALKSLLRKKDLFNLEAGIDINTTQAKTQRNVHLPVSVLRPLRYENFRKRWKAVRLSARLVDCQFRDLRKTGANLLKMKNHSNKLISEFLGHSNTDTTEIYMVKNADHLKPLAKDLDAIVNAL